MLSVCSSSGGVAKLADGVADNLLCPAGNDELDEFTVGIIPALMPILVRSTIVSATGQLTMMSTRSKVYSLSCLLIVAPYVGVADTGNSAVGCSFRT